MKKINIYENFEALPPAYERLFNEASLASGMFFSLYWFRHLLASTFEADKSVRIYGVEQGSDKLNAELALVMCPLRARNGLFLPRKLMPLANYYTSLFGPIIGKSPSNIEENLQILAMAIAEDIPRWDIVDFHPLAINDLQFDVFQEAFRHAGMAVQGYFCFGNWYLEVKGRPYHEYINSLPAKLKNTLIRKSKKLTDSSRLQMKIFTHIDHVDVGIAEYVKIYSASWKKPEPHPAFIPGLIRHFAAQGELRLGIAYIDQQAAAAQIWIVSNRVASIYKLAYDENYEKLSIGSILTAHLMQHVIDIDQVREVDYLTGDDAYKRDWMSHRRERWGMVAFNPRTVKGRLAALIHIGGRALKRVFGD
jgi:ribosomal protein S18 acetylase RimI-like enzyme